MMNKMGRFNIATRLNYRLMQSYTIPQRFNFCSKNESQEEADKKDKKSGKSSYEEKFGKNRRYEKPKFLSDEYDHLKSNENIDDDDFLPDYFNKDALDPDAPEIKRNPINLNLPWLINGAPEMDVKIRFVGDQIFSRLKVHKGEVLEHLYKIYRAVLLSASDGDYDFLREYWEENFADKFINRIEQLKKEEITFQVEEDFDSGPGTKSTIIPKPLEVEANIYDNTVIKGVTLDRKENGSEDDYIIHNDVENMGFVSYVPNYITKSENFTDPKKNKFMHEDAHHIVFRAYVNIKCGYRIHLLDKNGKDMIEYPKDYTWRHVAIFESQMSPPQTFKKWSLSESYMEWISKHTFGIWKLVDLDNWLVGNPLVIPKYEVRARSYKDMNDLES